MKIYTKTGDKGQTSLYDGSRTSKADSRMMAIGDIDELNSLLGVAVSICNYKEIAECINRVQDTLFVVGALLATPNPQKFLKNMELSKTDVLKLENDIDTWDKNITPLKNFILPGGSQLASILHLARSVCRRTERSIVQITNSKLQPEILEFVNRLSDWLFTLARYTNYKDKTQEIVWKGK